MTQVSVDIEDLERIVFATGAIKSVENALSAYKRDPFIAPHLNYAEAHDRLSEAMRHARRAEANDTLVKFDEPLTSEEASALRYVASACDARKPGLDVFVISPADKASDTMSVYDRLAAKGAIQVGQFIEGVVWAGAAGPDLIASEKGYAARLTARGKEKLAALPPPKKAKGP